MSGHRKTKHLESREDEKGQNHCDGYSISLGRFSAKESKECEGNFRRLRKVSHEKIKSNS